MTDLDPTPDSTPPRPEETLPAGGDGSQPASRPEAITELVREAQPAGDNGFQPSPTPRTATDLAQEPPPAAEPAAWSSFLQTNLSLALDLLLIALIALGVYFRFNWVNWNQDADLHPDEYGLTSTITRLSIPKSFGDYFNTRLSPISPYQKYDVNGNPTEPGPDNRMRWGQWPILLIRWAAEQTDRTDYGRLRLLGRQLSALFDTVSLLLIFLIGRRLYNQRVGLTAAELSALAVMQIQQSHFMTADAFAGTFVMLAMYCAVRVAQIVSAPTLPSAPALAGEPASRGVGEKSELWYALFGLFFGMALASRINLLPLFGMIFVAALIAYAERLQKDDLAQTLVDAGMRLALAGAVAGLTFRLTQPMTFRAEQGDTGLFTLNPNPDWVESMKVALAESSGVGGGPPGEQWTNRPALIFPFVNMVLWGMGLPLGLAAWAGFLWALWRTARDQTSWRAHLLPLVWAGGYFLYMGTRWVKSVRYFLPIYPFMALFAAWVIVELWNAGQRAKGHQGNSGELRGAAPDKGSLSFFSSLSSWLSLALGAFVLLGALAWAWGFTSIYRNDNTRIQASRWVYQNVPGPFNLHFETADGAYTEPLALPNGLPIAEEPYRLQFNSRITGNLTGLTLGHAIHANGSTTPGLLHAVLAADPDGRQVLAETDARIEPQSDDPRGDAVSVPFGPTAVQEDQTYYLFVSAPQGPLSLAGATVSNENWDEGLPLRLEGRDPFGGLYNGLTMEMHWFDNEDKRQMLVRNLATVDYIILPSQRRLWASTRLPNTYPMTMEFYRALFDGRLGFELAAQFQSPIVIGPLQVSDLVASAAWGRAPQVPNPDDLFNDNFLSAEEAFSVYDHAPVWIFRKRPDFDFVKAQAILYAFDLSTVVNQGPRDATKTRTRLMLPPDRLEAMRAGGTWREMFNAEGWLNKYQPLGVIAWWATLLVMGWAAFPLTFAAFGGLADRGYALAKTVALLIVAWFAWFLASFKVLPYTRGTIILGIAVLVAVSTFIVWQRRDEFSEYLRTRRNYVLSVEGIFLALFLFDLLIRLGNPDLWHPSYGGEKPMDFSYFNAVLKSVYFPPYDPWLAGGYINYYYYGYVIAGVPLKLLGIVPAFGYNLILPSLFAMLGINAFCAAYNLVSRQRSVDSSQKSVVSSQNLEAGSSGAEVDDPRSAVEAERVPTLHAPNPYLAGLAAALLIVVLGNLGQVKFLMKGFQRAADHTALAESLFGDNDFAATLNGAWRVMIGETDIPVGLGSWYWDATRIIASEEVEQAKREGGEERHGNEINEFPFFTFLYADLHAHMIDLPFTALALTWAVAYFLSVRRQRRRVESLALWVVGGLAFGVTRPTNTWDYPVYLALAAAAVLAAHWAKDDFRFTRAMLFDAGVRFALLVGLAKLLYLPYDQWFASGYTEFELWEGPKTPLNAYLYAHGLFLFVLATFLVWETRRWLAETPASVLADAPDWLPTLALALFVFALVVGVFLYLGAETAILSVPLMTWAGLLLLRSPQTMPLEKRVALFLLGTGLAITLFVEVVVLKGDIGRQNTIFKFYLQVWTLFSVAAGAALAWVWASLPAWKPSWQTGWTVALAALTAGAALYTLSAANAKIRDRFPPRTAVESADPAVDCKIIPGMPIPYPGNRSLAIEEQPLTLDGLAYLTWSGYCDKSYFLPLKYDYEAVRWMQDNVAGSPVIVEAQTFDLYRMSSRYAWNTGLPDVVGWDWHQRQQRAALPTDFINLRGIETSAFYETPDLDEARSFLQKYEVRYVVVGPMERAYYPPEGLAKFNALAARGELNVAYQNPGATIYAVP